MPARQRHTYVWVTCGCSFRSDQYGSRSRPDWCVHTSATQWGLAQRPHGYGLAWLVRKDDVHHMRPLCCLRRRVTGAWTARVIASRSLMLAGLAHRYGSWTAGRTAVCATCPASDVCLPELQSFHVADDAACEQELGGTELAHRCLTPLGGFQALVYERAGGCDGRGSSSSRALGCVQPCTLYSVHAGDDVQGRVPLVVRHAAADGDDLNAGHAWSGER